MRAALDEAQGEDDLAALDGKLSAARNETLGRIGQLLDAAGDAQGAARQVRALMFIERFGQDVEARIDQLGQ